MFMKQKHYEAPVLEDMGLQNETILCGSLTTESTLQEYEELTYDW